MAVAERQALIRRIEELRGSKLLCYLTSVRPNVSAVMSADAVRVVYDHLVLLPTRPVEKLDLFLVSNGGEGTVPWRLVALFREFANSFNVLVPYRAYSAATLLCLGADEIVMHPFAELGPIDPTVSNEFNPSDAAGRRLGISVEDVTAYVHFIKSTVGITHEDELVRAIEILAKQVHPLALGNVERFISQSRMLARKILRTHMDKETDEHQIGEIIENLASRLFFHGHPINRKEAKDDIKLKVVSDLSPSLEVGMWDLYKQYEEEMQMLDTFNPGADLLAEFGATPITTLPRLPNREYDLVHAIIESERLLSTFATRHRFTIISGLQQVIEGGPVYLAGQPSIRDDVLTQGWTHSSVPPAQNPQAPASSP
jgi:Serine dehydrogenase proteinase